MASNYERIFYNDYVNLLNKYEILAAEKKQWEKEKAELKHAHAKEIRALEELLAKSLNDNERWKNKSGKNSINSGKPSSTDTVTPTPETPKRTGANLYSGREKSDNKAGGQPGHPGHGLSRADVEKLIDEKKLEVKEIYHEISGPGQIKYRIGIDIVAYAEKHIFKHSDTSKEKLPAEFYTDVTYGNSIKSLCIDLGVYNVISFNRMSEFLSVVTDDAISVSQGSLCNFLKEFSDLSAETIASLRSNLLDGSIIFTDETTAKWSSKSLYFRNYSNEQTALYKAHSHKGHGSIKDDNILPVYIGGIMHDHDTALYKYGTYNYECNVHGGRYCKELEVNISYTQWPYRLRALLWRIMITREIAMKYKLKEFEPDLIKQYSDEYDQILEMAADENKDITFGFYKAKAKKLRNRCLKYKANHLAFMKDFSVPFDNNMSERDLRIIKTKSKISGGFRSLEAAGYYANAISIIKSAKKRGINPYRAITSIYENKSCLLS
jgi:hypothetical protein